MFFLTRLFRYFTCLLLTFSLYAKCNFLPSFIGLTQAESHTQCTLFVSTSPSSSLPPRLILTRPGLTRLTSAPQRCWAVAKRPQPGAGTLRRPAPHINRRRHAFIMVLTFLVCTHAHITSPPHCKCCSVCRLSSFFKMIVLVKR